MVQDLENCPTCGRPLAGRPSDGGSEITCSYCGTLHLLACFAPALERPVLVERGEPSVSGSEACCYFHQHQVAAETCHLCGRLLCRLCAMNAAGRMFCPVCLERATTQSEEPALRQEYSRQDRVALSLAWMPVALALCGAPGLLLDTSFGIGLMAGLMSTISFATMPMALFLVFKHWRRQQTPWGRTRARFVVAGILAGAELCFWLAVIALLIIGLVATISQGAAS